MTTVEERPLDLDGEWWRQVVESAIEVTPVKGVTYDPMPGGGSRAKEGNKVWRTRTYMDGRERTVGRYETVTEANEAMEAFYARRRDLETECERSGLSVATCYHCRGVNLPQARLGASNYYPSERRSSSRNRPREVIIAHRDFKYPCYDCGGPFVKGDRMRSSVGNLLVHEVCPKRP